MSAFRMPALGADMEAGTVVEWLRRPGDPVARGDVVAVIETQKGAIEIEVFEDGVLGRIMVPVGRKVPVGTVLAMIETPGGVPEPPAAPAPEPAPPPSGPPIAPATAPAGLGRRLRISPAAARKAAALGVDPASIAGTGPGGAIQLADVEAAVARPTPRRGFDPSAMRQGIAAAMARSKREIPHYYLARPVDMGAAAAWLRLENERRPVAERLLYGVLLLKAAALALRELPQFNGFWVDGAPRLSERVHLGWAISLRGGGLIAPAVHDADTKSLDALMAALRDLVTRARTARIRGSEMTDPTATVTSLGERGAERVYGIIYPPQLALVGFGGLHDAPAVVEGRVVVRPTVVATLAADHRATDGALGQRLLEAIDGHLQQPELL